MPRRKIRSRRKHDYIYGLLEIIEMTPILRDYVAKSKS